MQYVMLNYEKTETFAARTNDQQEAYWGAWTAYIAALNEAGIMVGGQGLQPPTVATTVRLADGKRHVQDGPYADTKEQLAGFFILELPSLDDAMQWAARCPAASDGVVEIRPVLVMSPP
ncbi:MAG: YciI family protein [Cytophagales bacterium]|nr:YciI family protein [Armatimonadota bacterium]